MKKKNWVKGLDRIALLLTIPLAIFGAHYCSKKYAQFQAVEVFLTYDDDEMLNRASDKNCSKLSGTIFEQFFLEEKIFGSPNANGIIADGKGELQRVTSKHPLSKQALERAFEEGGDAKGTLIKNELFGLNHYHHKQISIIPSKSKRYFIGALGALGCAISLILAVGLSTRIIPKVFRWVKDGFNS